MKRLRNHLIGVEQGSELLFSDYQDGGEMWTGEGPREARRAVGFSQDFKSLPAVQVAVSMYDMDGGTNQRADLRAEAVTRSGFELVFRTWGDSRIARIRADWLAIGEIRGEDEWDVD
ncbi:hypothetical protein HKCCE2091_07835 [Rhodobacterales bacterium HKCCE2091]|nr:hypothetical protein [Rhodobacterales bacterium HKCCE2091]